LVFRVAIAVFSIALSLFAGTPPSGFTEFPVAASLNQPTAFAFAPDGRIFVCEQGGALRVIKNSSLLQTPFLTVQVDSTVERGLLGVAVDPQFASNGFVYIYYTMGTVTPPRNRVSRFTANGDVAIPGSETVLLELDDLNDSPTHNGGALRFGPDGKLYIAVGENGVGANAQLLTNLLGKMLRMNKDGTIPSDNPNLGTTGKNRLIWAYGLRNPFTFNFDPRTGQMFINDVGQSLWEEVNLGAAGANYGWPDTEGATADPEFVSPYYAYPHTYGFFPGCAIAGGAFYNPQNPTFPAPYLGRYFFADLCGGWIVSINPQDGASPSLFLSDAESPVAIEVSPDGDLYYLERGTGGSTGAVKRIRSTSPQAPAIVVQPEDIQAFAGASATFSVAAAPQPLTYQWRRNGVNIPGATSATYTLTGVQLSDSLSTFSVLVTNSLGSVASEGAVLTVLSATPPTAVILSPAEGSLFKAGDTITFAATAEDQFDNVIQPSTFRWRVDYITGSATRPFVQEFTGPGGSFSVPAVTPYTLPDVYFLIYLTVTDSQGLPATVVRRVDPRVSQFTFTSSHPGVQLTLDGQPFTPPRTVSSVVGLTRPIGASTQENAGVRHNFVSWSDGGAATHNITVSETPASYAAVFAQQFLLTTGANPANGGTVTAGGWFNSGTTHSVSATPAAGYRFTGFTGDLTGASPQNIVMNTPRTVTANFACVASLSAPSLSAGAAGGGAAVAVTTGAGCSWSATGLPDWIHLNSGSPAVGSGTVTFILQPNSSGASRMATLTISGEPFTVTQAAASTQCAFQLSATSGSVAASGGLITVNVTTASNCSWNVVTRDSWVTVVASGSNIGTSAITLSIAANSTAQPRSSQVTIAGETFTVTQPGGSNGGVASGLSFVPMQPCRLVETRHDYNFQGRTAPFGPPLLSGGEARTIVPSLSNVCQIPASAKAYVLNVTLAPFSGVDYVTIWPAGTPRPDVWTVRSPDGQIVANSAIVQAGQNGGIVVYASSPTDLIIDISGYFTDDRTVSTSAYYPMQPCRAIETRALYRPEPGPFGPPTLNAGERRSYRLPASPHCQVPAGAKAYTLMITAVPPASLPFLTAWPTGGEQPNVSTLNSPAGRVIANSVIVPASADGSIDVRALDRTDILVDITGYFASDDGVRGLFYFPVTQCRAYDSQTQLILQDDSVRTIAVPSAPQCSAIPSNAQAYALNVTALPAGSPMPFLTVYATGAPRPNSSILNAFEGQIMTNSAVVPAGMNGAIDVYAFRRTHVVVEVSGYFLR